MKRILCFVAVACLSVMLSHAQEIKDVRTLNSSAVEVVYTNGQTMTVDFYGPDIFRLFRDPQGGILRQPEATPMAEILVTNPRVATKASLEKGKDGYQVKAGNVRITLCAKTGLMRVEDTRTGRVVMEQTAEPNFEKDGFALTLACHDGEYFYGGGVQNGRFSHRGQVIAIENTNNWVDGGVASPCPFFWSTKGYGVMFHTFRPGRYDFGATEAGTVSLSHEERYLDAFVMVDDTPTALLADFYQLTGHPVLLPKYGFFEGHLNAYNRDYWTPAEKGVMAFEDGKFYSESQKDNGGVKESLNGEKPGSYQFSARAVVDRYLDNDMPMGWILPNDGYATGYGQDSTLDGNIENLRRFGEYTRSRGVEVGLWTQSDLHPKEGVEALLQRDIVKEVRDAGVRVLKTDVAWVGAGYSFGLNGVSDVGEVMPYYGGDARPFIISVDGWAGTQRYAGIWTGDQTGGNWEYIRYHIPTFIGSGLSGQPNITNDVDGIFGGKNLPVNVREFQWKTYTPMELNMDGWGSHPKYPQGLGEPATSINRWYLKQKSALMPYTYSIAREAVDGKPMVRAMFLDYPCDYTYGTQTRYQFMYGPSLLVAPVYQNTAADDEGNDVRHGIYLPEGTWYDYYTGERYDGGRIVNGFKAPLWKLPVFAKSGAIIPLTKAHNNPSQAPKNYRAYEIFPGGESTFSEYDDDGRTQAYLGGECARTSLSVKQQGGKVVVKVAATEGGFEGFQTRKQTQFFIHATQAPKSVSVKVGGKKVKTDWQYEAEPMAETFSETLKVKAPSRIVVSVPETDITQNAIELTVNGWADNQPADPSLKSHGNLSTVRSATQGDACQSKNSQLSALNSPGAYTLTPSWQPVENADYYEVAFQGQTYTVAATQLAFDGLTPETTYTFRLRPVNVDGVGSWTDLTATTAADPYKWAVRNVKASATCEDQPGTEVQKLFDFDGKTSWHSKWGKGEAVPFDMTLDLRGIVSLDRLEYQPRHDAGNGTILSGTWQASTDRENWTEPQPFQWEKSGEVKTVNCQLSTVNCQLSTVRSATQGDACQSKNSQLSARYIRLHIDAAVGNFGSGQAMYVYRQPDTEITLQGDINRDKRIDDNDFTSYMNYTGLRTVDSDYDYVSIGDVNHNGLIDAYDISVVATELEGGVENSADKVSGSLTLTPSVKTWKAGDEVRVTVKGDALHCVNALSFGLPYNTDELEYLGLELKGMKEMQNLTSDRLHSNGQKELLPTFVNLGTAPLLEEGSPELFVIKFRAKKAGKWALKAVDGMLVDRNLGVVKILP